ncbi:MAG: DUF6400 family protein [Pseudonocardiaceae bacterium]
MASHVPFNIDLTAHEAARLAAVLGALGTSWDPTAVHVGEAQARQMPCTDLDHDQQAAYDALTAGGVLPDTPE